MRTGISRTPLRYLPQKLGITHEMRGPIETHRLFYLGRVAQIEPAAFSSRRRRM